MRIVQMSDLHAPPKTIDVDAGDGTTCRYGLSEWMQAGPTAAYTFLDPV